MRVPLFMPDEVGGPEPALQPGKPKAFPVWMLYKRRRLSQVWMLLMETTQHPVSGCPSYISMLA